MLRDHQRLIHRGNQVTDLLLIGAAMWLTRGHSETASETGPLLWQIGLVLTTWVVVAVRLNFYQTRRTEAIAVELRGLLEAWTITLGIGTLASLACFGQPAFAPVYVFVTAGVGIGLARLALRSTLHRIRYAGLNYRRVVLVGRGANSHDIAANVARSPHFGIRIAGSIRLPGESGPAPVGVPDLGEANTIARLFNTLEVDSVLLCPSLAANSEDTQYVLEKCDTAGIPCVYAPEYLSLANLIATTTTFAGIPGFTFNPRLGSPFQLAVKRWIDIVGASIGIALCLPVMMMIAIAIKLTDRGPLLFRQVRIGRDGQKFYCLKFRSMCIDAEAKKAELKALNEADGPVFKIRKDPRITPIGRLIRKYSLDELPQLFNVLFGDMSLVGPRPPVPAEVEQYSWWQRRRISVRPGITCLWQVKGRNKVSFDKWMEMDLFYIDNWSLWMDIKLILQTMPAVFRGTGV